MCRGIPSKSSNSRNLCGSYTLSSEAFTFFRIWKKFHRDLVSVPTDGPTECGLLLPTPLQSFSSLPIFLPGSNNYPSIYPAPREDCLHTANSLLTTVKMTPRARPPSAQTPPPPPPATKTRERRRRRRSFSATSILSNETAEKSHGRLVNKPPPLPATLERTERGRVGERGGDRGRKGASRSMLLAPLVPNSMDQH